MKNTILTLLLLGCFAFSLSAQTENQIEEAPVMIDHDVKGDADAPPPPPPPPPAPRAEEVFKVVEDMPTFPGCDDVSDKNARHQCGKEKMLKYISDHPAWKEQRDRGSSATAVIRFVVRKDGSIDNVRTVRAHTDDMDAVLSINSIFEEMPKWTPGKQRGQAVDVEMNVPVQFR